MADIELVIKIDEEEYKIIKACTSFMPWAEYLIKNGTPLNNILDKIYADIQRLRGCSCSCSDGIIDDVEDIIEKYRGEVDCRECKAEYECYYCKRYEESEVRNDNIQRMV